MRVALLSGIFPPDIGGPATHSADLATELRRRGHAVTVVTLHDARRPDAPDVVSFARSRPWPIRLAAIIGWLVAHRDRYDVIYATGLLHPAVLAARLARRPVIVKIVGDPAWERGRRRGLTDLAFDDFQRAGGGRLPLRLMRASRSRAVARADAVVVPTPYLARTVQLWSRSARVSVVPNGAHVPETRGVTSARTRDGELRAVYVGRLVAHKRVDVLIDAVASAHDIRLEIIGDGPELARLREQAERRGVADRVQFAGALSHDDVLRRLDAARALVSATSYEGLPHTHLEAIAHGCPVVTSASGGTTDVIVDGVNGLIVDPPTAGHFAAALGGLHADADRWEQLCAGARRTAEEWSFERCADRIEAVLEQQLDSPKPTAIFVGKSAVDDFQGPTFRGKVTVHDRYVRSIFVTAGTPAEPPPGDATIACLPGPPGLARRAYYLLAPLVAIRVALRAGRRNQRSVGIVCKSPFEAVGVVALSRLLPPSRRPRIQVELHGDWRTASRLYGSPARRLVSSVADRAAEWALRRADRVRPVSEILAAQAREAGCPAPIDIHIAYSDYSEFLTQPPQPTPDVRQVVFVGVFERYKAVDVLLDAWRLVVEQVPDGRLVMIGTGSQFDDVKRQVSRGPLAVSVSLTGQLPRRQVLDVIDRSRCLVLPSRAEGLGRVLIEAMARARPVVASAVGGIPEVFEDGKDGRLVPPGDAAALATALIELLCDPVLARELGEHGRATVENRDPAEEYDAGIARLSAWLRSA